MMTEHNASPKSLLASPYLMLILPPLFWAGNAIAGRIAMVDISPFALSFWRWVVALLVLLPFTLLGVLAHRRILLARWKRIMVLGALSVGGYNLFLYLALQTTTAINATLVGSTMPLVIMLISFLWLREPFGMARTAGLVVSVVGVTLVIGRGDPTVLSGLELHQGDLYMLAAVFTWSLFSVTLRAYPPGVPPLVFLTAQVMAGLLLVGPLYLGALALGGGQMPVTWNSLGITVFTALFPALGSFYFWNKGVAAVGANAAGFYTNLVPLFTALLAAPILGEAVYWYHAASLVLIFAGITLATMVHGRMQRASSE